MKKATYIITLLIITIWGCKTSSKLLDTTDNFTEASFLALLKAEIKQDSVIYARIDTLLKELLEMEYNGCNIAFTKTAYHPMHYSSVATYLENYPGCNPIFQELEFLHSKSWKYERYLHERVADFREYQDENKKKWLKCLFLFRKTDCTERSVIDRLNRLPYILRDTTDVEYSNELINLTTKIIDEPCSNTLKFLQSEVEWRKEMYYSLMIQLDFFLENGMDEYGYDEDVYWLMSKLPDRLTTRFAYEYIMNSDLPLNEHDLKAYIFDIIESRLKNWGVAYGRFTTEGGYSFYEGESVFLTKDEIRNLINRTNQIAKLGKCEWCENFVSRLKLGLKNE